MRARADTPGAVLAAASCRSTSMVARRTDRVEHNAGAQRWRAGARGHHQGRAARRRARPHRHLLAARRRGESVEDWMAHAGHAMLDAMKARLAAAGQRARRRCATRSRCTSPRTRWAFRRERGVAPAEGGDRRARPPRHHPHSRFRTAWEAVGAALVLTICVMLPVEVAFWDVCTSAESGYPRRRRGAPSPPSSTSSS